MYYRTPDAPDVYREMLLVPFPLAASSRGTSYPLLPFASRFGRMR